MTENETEIIEKLLEKLPTNKLDYQWANWLLFTDRKLTKKDHERLITLQERYFGYGYERRNAK